MGGGAALLLSNVLANGAAATAATPFFAAHRAALERAVLPRFRGAVLLCPVVRMAIPGWARALLVSPLAALLPESTLPAALFDENSGNAQVWAGTAYRRYIEADGWPRNPAGLSYGQNIRFRTLASILELAAAVQASLPQAAFPFLVLHDEPGDVVVPFAGSQELHDAAPARSKALVRVPGGLHDILANRVHEATREITSWLRAQLAGWAAPA